MLQRLMFHQFRALSNVINCLDDIPVVAIPYVTFNEIFVEHFTEDELYIWMGLTAILIYLAAASNYNMMKCSMTDPGILPARRWPYYVAAKYEVPPVKKPEKWESLKQ